MVRGVEGNEMSTPRPSQKKQPSAGSQSAKNQKSILGFFQKKSTNSPSPVPSQPTPVKQTPTPTLSKKPFSRPPPSLTPVPSSDAPEPSSPIRHHEEDTPIAGRNKENGLLSRITSPGTETDRIVSEVAGVALSSPSRKVRTLFVPRWPGANSSHRAERQSIMPSLKKMKTMYLGRLRTTRGLGRQSGKGLASKTTQTMSSD